VVVATGRAEPHPAASNAVTEMITARRIELPQRNGASLAARPVTNVLPSETGYLTTAGIPLILPAFKSLNCLATALRIDAGTRELHLP
jgi:hypothetical protein